MSSARGRQRRRREILRGGAAIEAPPGPRGVLDVLVSQVSAWEVGAGSHGYAEAGASPSSDTLPLAHRASAAVGRPQPKGRKAVRAGMRELGGLAGARVVSRLQKLERRIFLVRLFAG